MAVLNYNMEEKRLVALAKKKKEEIFLDLLNLEKEIGDKNLGDLEDKLESKDSNSLFTLSNEGKITSYLIYKKTNKPKRNYIILDKIRVAENEDFEKNLFSLIDSVRVRKSYQDLKWMRTWIKQDFSNIRLCEALAKYGFHSFDDPEYIDTTRFAFKEVFKSK